MNPKLTMQEKLKDLRVERILAGETCALVSDAGSPAISDPGTEGFLNIKKARSNALLGC